MKEVAFLKQNAEKWQQFEKLLSERKSARADVLADLFISVTDDLAYARTHYPGSRTTVYLNQLAGRVHREIYRNKREDRGRIARFWKRELPLTVARHQRTIAVSLVIFAASMLVGVLSSAGDAGFVRLIMGDAYVNMTLANIEGGDPMAVYKEMHQADMFVGITFNNVMVSFTAFALGILASLGTVWVLVQNGIMVGAFQFFFHQHDLLFESFLVIWIHGTLEISAIVIAGGAGLAMGNSLLFPGTYSRRVSFTRGARDGLKIIIGLVPIFIFAGFLESFVTRYTDMPIALSLAIIGGSLAFILWYFVVFPRSLHRAGHAETMTEATQSLTRTAPSHPDSNPSEWNPIRK